MLSPMSLSSSLSPSPSPSLPPSSFLPLTHPHVYGFSLPLVFSFLLSSHFPILLQITKHKIWRNALKDPLTSAHYSWTIDLDSNSDSKSFGLCGFLFLSPLFVSHIKHFILKSPLLCPYPHWTFEEEMKYVAKEDQYVENLKEIIAKWKEISDLCSTNLQNKGKVLTSSTLLSSEVNSPSCGTDSEQEKKSDIHDGHHFSLLPSHSLSLLPPSFSLRSFVISLTMVSYGEATRELIQRVVEEIIKFRKYFLAKQLAVSKSPFLLRFNIRCGKNDNNDPSALDIFINNHMIPWNERCSQEDIQMNIQWFVQSEGSDREDKIVWREIIRKKYDYFLMMSQQSPSISPSPLYPFLHITSLNVMGLRSNRTDDNNIPLSTLLPLTCPFLSSLSFTSTPQWSESDYLDVGQIFHNMRHSLTSITFMVNDRTLPDYDSGLVRSISSMIFMFAHMSDEYYPNITQLDIISRELGKWVQQSYLSSQWKEFYALLRKFPNISSLLVSAYRISWMFTLPMPVEMEREMNVETERMRRENQIKMENGDESEVSSPLSSTLLSFLSSIPNLTLQTDSHSSSSSRCFHNLKSLSLFYLFGSDNDPLNPSFVLLLPLFIHHSFSHSLTHLHWGNIFQSFHHTDSVKLSSAQRIYESLCHAVSMCHLLQSFTLEHGHVTCHQLLSMVANALSHCHLLTQLDIKCDDSIWSQEGLMSLTENISNDPFSHPRLTSLTLSKMNSRKTMEYIGDFLLGLPMLRNLNINLMEMDEGKKEEKKDKKDHLLDHCHQDSTEQISTNVLHSLSKMKYLRHFTLHCSSEIFLSHWSDKFFSSLCSNHLGIQSITFHLMAFIANVLPLVHHLSSLLDSINSFYLLRDKYPIQSLVRLREFNVTLKNHCYGSVCWTECYTVGLAGQRRIETETTCPLEGKIHSALDKMNQCDVERMTLQHSPSSSSLNISAVTDIFHGHFKDHKEGMSRNWKLAEGWVKIGE